MASQTYLYKVRNFKPNETKCFYCGEILSTCHIDHFIPKSKGGSSRKENLRFACRDCNIIKGNIMPSELIKKLETIITHLKAQQNG